MIIVIVGSDGLAVDDHVQRILQQYDPTGFSTTTIDGTTATTLQILNAVSTAPFFGESRVAVISAAFRKGPESANTTSKAKSPAVDYQIVFSGLADHCHLVLVDRDSLDVPAAIAKLLPPDHIVHRCKPARGQQLIRWLMDEADALGATMDADVARSLAIRHYPNTWNEEPRNVAFDVPPDLAMLQLELLKLAMYTDGKIDEEVIALLTPISEGNAIFPLLDAYTGGKTQDMVRAIQKLLVAGEEPSKLLNSLLQQAELAAVATAHGRPTELSEAGKDLKLSNPSRMKAVSAAARSSKTSPAETAKRALTTDRKLKVGVIAKPTDALYFLLPEHSD